MPYYVYILRSQLDGSLYKGYTEDLQIRLSSHNAGKVKSTKSKRKWDLAYFEEYPTLSQALSREKYLKTSTGRKFIKTLGLWFWCGFPVRLNIVRAGSPAPGTKSGRPILLIGNLWLFHLQNFLPQNYPGKNISQDGLVGAIPTFNPELINRKSVRAEPLIPWG